MFTPSATLRYLGECVEVAAIRGSPFVDDCPRRFEIGPEAADVQAQRFPRPDTLMRLPHFVLTGGETFELSEEHFGRPPRLAGLPPRPALISPIALQRLDAPRTYEGGEHKRLFCAISAGRNNANNTLQDIAVRRATI